MTEIKLFYDWLETYPLSPASIALWHALMFIANRSGWPQEFCASAGLLALRTNLSHSTIYRERMRLRTAGRISFRPQGGAADSIYEIHSLECAFASRIASQRGTQIESEFDSVSRIASHTGTRLNKLNRVINPEKEKTSKKEKAGGARQERKSCAKKRESTRLNQAQFLSTLDDRWRELMSVWLEYKRTRRESYRSEVGAKKCFAMLRNLSDDDPSVAAAIIDRSIANNWAGLFPLRTGQTPVSAYGQHPGQIIQPADDERTRNLLEKFGRK